MNEAGNTTHYCAFEITDKGIELRQRAFAGANKDESLKVEFTRGAIGQGRPSPETDIYYMTGLVDHAADVPIKESYAKSKNHIMVIVIDGQQFTEDICMTEIGIYARLIDAVTGEEVLPELLYGYTYTEKYDFIPSGSDYNLHREIAFNTVLSRDGKFEIVFDKSLVYVTHRDLEDALQKFKEELEKLYESDIVIRHGLDTYPNITAVELTGGFGRSRFGKSAFGIGNAMKVRCDVRYIGRNTVQLLTDKKYGEAKAITFTNPQECIVTFLDSDISLCLIFFTNKTGTVTENEAEPVKVFLSGVSIGDTPPENKELLWLSESQS